MAFVKIKSKKVTLRDRQLKDVETFFSWNNARYHWMDTNDPYFGQNILNDISECDRIKKRIKYKSFSNPRNNIVIADNENDQMLGTCTWYWQIEQTNWLSVGVVIYNHEFWNQGIGFEALGMFCQYLWDAKPALSRLDLRTYSGNPGMVRLAEKLGFKEEARFSNAVQVDGIFYDNLGFGILKDEWNLKLPIGFNN